LIDVRIPTFVEVPRSSGAVVNPRLVELSVIEPAILNRNVPLAKDSGLSPFLRNTDLTTNSHIENKIEVLIKGRVRSPGLLPGVRNHSRVIDLAVKVAPLPHILLPLKLHVEHLFQPTIEISEEVVFAPFEPICVKAVGEIFTAEKLVTVCHPVGVKFRGGPPVKGGGDDVATKRICPVIAAHFCDVNFARSGPRTIFFLLGHHP
jgi:hypothetical protein